MKSGVDTAASRWQLLPQKKKDKNHHLTADGRFLASCRRRNTQVASASHHFRRRNSLTKPKLILILASNVVLVFITIAKFCSRACRPKDNLHGEHGRKGSVKCEGKIHLCSSLLFWLEGGGITRLLSRRQVSFSAPEQRKRGQVM